MGFLPGWQDVALTSLGMARASKHLINTLWANKADFKGQAPMKTDRCVTSRHLTRSVKDAL